jgi:hypothetical protein
MDAAVMWAIGSVVTLSIFGFKLLYDKIESNVKTVNDKVESNVKVFNALGSEVDKNREEAETLGKRIDVVSATAAVLSKEVESKTDFKYVNDEFYKKEMAKLQFDNISQQMSEMKMDFKSLCAAIEKLSDKIDNNHNKKVGG